ncbi:MAG: twin-arginine translocation signal domain-containing protein, partial [Deltaproteobacteria bacterium]
MSSKLTRRTFIEGAAALGAVALTAPRLGEPDATAVPTATAPAA